MMANALLCNGIQNPLGVDSPRPRFSWLGGVQSAYRLIVATSADLLARERGDAWDSGVVRSDRTQCIAYEGVGLASAMKYHWKVKTWDSEGGEGPWSEAATFETGLLHASDWTARWIEAPKPVTPAKFNLPAPFFRKTFTLKTGVENARVWVCGAGYFELYVNGHKVGREVLNPPFTAYDRTCLYCTYDIADYLEPGENVIGAVLGNGMYFVNHKNAWDFEKAPWKANPKLILQASVLQADGETVKVCSGSSWKCAAGPITSDSLYVGETYDARLEMPGWSAPGFDDGGWKQAVVCRAPGGVLKSMQMEPIRVVEEFRPKSLREVKPGIWVYDMGRSIAGWTRLRVSGTAGTAVGLQHAELLGVDGDIETKNIEHLVESEKFQYDEYTLKGKGVETWEPRFTYHGFQYVRLTGYPGTPDLESLTCCVVHTDLRTAGGFSCSNDIINRIHEAARAATANNYHGMPTDCPHREKNGWTGDALISAEQVLLNFNPVNAYQKWLDDIIDCQRPTGQLPGIAPTGGWGYNWGSGPAWDSIIVLLPYYIWLYTGDTAVLEQCWDAACRYIGFMDSMSEDGTVDFGLGDWCPPEGGAEGAKTPTAVSDTWFYYADCLIASKIAAILGKPESQVVFAGKAETVRQAFLRRFVDGQTGDVAGSCQTSYALALHFGIVRGGLAQKVFSRLVDEVEAHNRHIDCGMQGAKFVLQVLSDWGRADLAWAIASQTDFPSWGKWIVDGATTMPETWDADRNASLNHHMFSDVSAFFYKAIAGINPDESAPGFQHTNLKPNPVEGLDHAEGWHETPYGTIRCAWRKTAEGLALQVEVPEGTAATLRLPAPYSVAAIGGVNMPLARGLNLTAGKYAILAN